MATQTITVRNATELNQALSNATGGETILLEAGDYGRLNLTGAQYASNVSIKSADPNAMASFSEAYVKGSANITFDTVVFDYNYSSGESKFASKFRVENSSNVTFKDSIFDGDAASGTGTAADGLGTGKGLVVKGSTNVDIIDSEFHSWWAGLTVNTSTDLHIAGNNIHNIRSDGMKLGNLQKVLVENNYIHDFNGDASLKDHRDMIQIQRSSGIGVQDLTIRNNVFDMGSGDWTQTIWAGHDRADPNDPTNWHQNVLIENNLIYNAHTHGISVNLTDGLTITNNTLIAVDRAQTGGITIPKISVSSGSKDVVIEQNVTTAVVGENGQADWSVQNNAIIQNTNPSAPGYYDSLFTYYATTQADGYNQYGVISGSTIDTLNAGSSLVDSFPFDYNTWVDASSTTVGTGTGGGTGTTGGTGTGGGTDTSGTGTGGTGTGTTGGTGTGGTDTSGTGGTDTSGTGTGGTGTGGTQPQMVFDDFVLDIAGLPDNGQATLKGDAAIVNTGSGPVIHFDGHKDLVKMGRLNQFEDSEQIAFTVEFTRDEADGSMQRLVWNKGHVGLTLTGDGLVAHAENNDARFGKGFEVKNIGLNDTDTHTITLMVDQVTDRLQILVDGNVVLDETSTDFDFVGGREFGWNLGFGWNRYIDGEVSAFAIDDEVQFIDPPAAQDSFFI